MASRPVRVQTSGALPSRPLRALPSRPARGRATGPTPRVSAPALRLVPGGDAGRTPRGLLGSRRAPFVLLVVALLVLTTLGLLVLNTAVAVNSLKATALRTANAEKAEEVQRLEQQVVDGATPAQLAAAAAAAGLVPAGAAAYLVVAPDGSATLRGTPEPAPAPGEPEAGEGG
ncbi:cell division protein FtsI (penicillin-binding protein 3) [Geodermatophilus telluris]|uniref:Cell division protein FtsI (Penicillin-binding protein 3) n=2 Tax=Geodermatophilus telluris TaxID=1190417 RepID=A0A1G6S668_9ACTN|nr:cell division protein FtsI (penicillin-binding protein 3) [Geodermatophilus telluris]